VVHVCFQEFDSMLKNSIPEIQRCNLTSVVLQLLALDIDTLTFNFMDMPPKEVSLLSCYFKFMNLT
jgi:HrpA-like RNA helicase